MKKGVQLYTVRDFISDRAMVAESLRKIREIGYEAIQASTPPFMTDAEMKQQMDDAGLGTFSANADFELLENDANALRAAVEQAISTAWISWPSARFRNHCANPGTGTCALRNGQTGWWKSSGRKI
jgi:hypothetical protein